MVLKLNIGNAQGVCDSTLHKLYQSLKAHAWKIPGKGLGFKKKFVSTVESFKFVALQNDLHTEITSVKRLLSPEAYCLHDVSH